MVSASSTNMQTLLVGLDAACASVLDPLAADNAIPTLESVRSDGVSGPLRSQIPPWTPSAWPTLYTGTNPGKHGVFGFLDFDGYDYDVVDGSLVREHPIWQLLDHHGLSSVVVNVPVTHPPCSFDGALIPGYTAPDQPPCHPDGLLEDLDSTIGAYRIYPGSTSSRAQQLEAYRELIELRGRAFRTLSERIGPDFGFLQFQVCDTVCHELPGDWEALREVYRAIDRQVETTIEQCDPETVLIASDHGIGEYTGQEVRVNEALRRAGFLETTNGGAGMPTWSRIRNSSLRGDSSANTNGRLERGMAALALVGLTSQRIGRALGRLGIDEIVARHVPSSVVSAGTEQVSFPASTAYVRSRIECGVRLNVAGREPEGVVDPSEYDAVRETIIEQLSELRLPDGTPAFDAVTPREQFFHGPELEDAVDIVTVPTNFDQFISARLAADVFGEPSESWNHKRDGIVAISGEAVTASPSVEGATLVDIAPTVLATVGLSSPERVDGRVLPAVEPVGRERYPSCERERIQPVEGGAVESRLADIGYLE